MKLKFILILTLFCIIPNYAQKLPFIFLGVKTDFQPDFSLKLESLISKKLDNLKKLDQLTPIEIRELTTSGIISDKIPTEIQSKLITELMGPVIITSIYLQKFRSKAKNNLWPPFSRTIKISGKAELVILNTQSGEILFTGDILAEAKITKLFSKTQTAEPYKFLNAVDRNKLLNTLLINLASEISIRIQQIIAGFSFTSE